MKKALWGIVPTLVLVSFITLKLCKVIAWSWWWVLAPAWIPIVFVLIVAVICFIILVQVLRKPHQIFNGINFGK